MHRGEIRLKYDRKAQRKTAGQASGRANIRKKVTHNTYALLGRGVGVGRGPGRGSLDEVGDGVPETHCMMRAEERRAVYLGRKGSMGGCWAWMRLESSFDNRATLELPAKIREAKSRRASNWQALIGCEVWPSKVPGVPASHVAQSRSKVLFPSFPIAIAVLRSRNSTSTAELGAGLQNCNILKVP
jgi:hypothetical protein